MDDPTTASLRPRSSNLSLRPISNGTGSTRSAASRVGSYRHSLLKSNSQRQQSIEKDLPVPPVLTSGDSCPIVQSLRPGEPASQNSKQPEASMPPNDPIAPGPTGTNVEEATGGGVYSSVDGYDHFRTSRLPTPKVRPAVCNIERNVDIDNQGEYSPVNQIPPVEAYSVEPHFQHSHPSTPKVRPFTESPFVDASYLRDGDEETNQTPTSCLSPQVHRQGGGMYWGFLPRFKDRGESKQPASSLREESVQDSRKSLTNIQPEDAESNLKQENIRELDRASDRGLGDGKGNSESQNASRSSGKRSDKSIAVTSPPQLSTSGSANVDERRESPVLQRQATGRKTGWFRRLLGYPGTNTSPPLTKLPERSSPPQAPRDDADSIASGVTTYSLDNAAGKAAMDKAVESMEKILTEALSLADEAGRRECEHIDDGHLPLKAPSEISIHTPSVHESMRQGSSEHEEGIVATPIPNGITTTSSMKDASKASTPQAPKRSGLVKSTKRDGKFSKPSFIKRLRKATSNIENRHHAIDDACVLPLPASDLPITGSIALTPGEVPDSSEVKEYIKICHQPPIRNRGSSNLPCEPNGSMHDDPDSGWANKLSEIRRQDMSVCSLDGGTSDEAVEFSTTQYSTGERRFPRFPNFRGVSRRARTEKPAKEPDNPRKRRMIPTKHDHELRNVSLRNRSHSPGRKRFVASVACISTALIGVLVGIYAGLVPSIQYYIADFHHYTILGNVGLYLGMALPNFLCWPLPLLHGRKPYIVGGLCIAMPLLFPQAIAISTQRSPTTPVWRVALLLSRGLMGFALGFAKMNFHSILTDLFGASLMSNTPHQEVVDEYDVRRHGGGLGVWLGIWTWCFIGSISVGFVVGAVVIEHLQPSWGLYISIIIIAAVLLLNVLCPEVRRSAWRRSVAEVRMGETISRRLARGEVMMHRVQTGPKWWGQEVYHGVALSLEMLRQPGFTIMAVYSAWIYAQIILVIVLLGSLTSKSYRYRSPYVGAVVSSVAIGGFLAIPFQKANIFSRARNMSPMSNKTTFDKKITWSSHLVRRAIFTLVLPIAGIVYTVVSTGPPIHVFFPSFFAALIGFLSCLAISECNGMLMENWDCSDLQPGMTGRSKSSKDSHKRTNYSSFPRATAGWNLIQSFGFILAAGATGLGGSITRRVGQRTATGIVAGILFILSLLLLGSFFRFKRVQIIPDCTCSEMDRWTKERRVSLHNWAAAMAAAKEKGKNELNEIPEEDVG
ncbi:hypothetical protein F5Y03DRAFT_404821 [Xylaria venustula]|nr:hypothetical protein F5Y03DRAFT_404821 [Xylaria venustula]